MTIQEFLLKYRKPLYEAAGEGGSGGGDSSGGDTGSSNDAGNNAGNGDNSGDSSAGGPGDGSGGSILTGDNSDAGGDAGNGDDNGSDDKGGDDTKGDGKDGSDDNESDTSGDFAVTVPEGMEAFEADFAKYSESASDWLKDNPKASAADALKWAAEKQAENVQASVSQGEADFVKQNDKWVGELKADSDFGGDKYDQNVAVAGKAIEAFGSPELKTLLSQSGLGSHPELVKFAHKAGKALQEAPHVPPSGASTPSREQQLADIYDHPTS